MAILPNRQRGSPHSYQNGKTHDRSTDPSDAESQRNEITNEYVLNVAFWTFLAFLLMEAVFALIANSQSMLEDSEAMSVDALTYLFNLCAERIKHRPYSEKEMALPAEVREYKRQLLRLYLEVVPPLVSLSTLIIVTAYAIEDALSTLKQPDDVPKEAVNVSIMMRFSGANLLLDIVNVACFARAHQAYGFKAMRNSEMATARYSARGSDDVVGDRELQRLVDDDSSGGDGSTDFGGMHVGEQLLVNLNMCSAWTHVCADTLRSSAVLIAAVISVLWPESLSGELADSMATIVVSIVILVSLIPLLQGLIATSRQIVTLSTDPTRPLY